MSYRTLFQVHGPMAAKDPEFSTGQRVCGHLSLWLLALAIGIFKLWRWYHGYPPDADVPLLGGFLELEVSLVAAFFNFLLGWLGLTALLSIGNLRRIFIDLHRPLHLIEDPELRKFYCAPATLVFSALLLAATVELTASVWVLRVEAPYELTVHLPPGQDAFFIDTQSQAALSSSSSAELVLRGWRPTAVLTFRDKYNLRTLDAIRFRRRPLGFDIEDCQRQIDGLPSPQRSTQRWRTTPKRLQIVSELRWGDERIELPITLVDGSIKEGGWIRPGEAAEGPERVPRHYAQAFLDRMYSERSRLARWAERPSTERVVLHEIDGYELKLEFQDGQIECKGLNALGLREATVLHAKEKS